MIAEVIDSLAELEMPLQRFPELGAAEGVAAITPPERWALLRRLRQLAEETKP